MLRATIWRDLRWRLLAALLLVGPLAYAIAAVQVLQSRADRTRLAAGHGSIDFSSTPRTTSDGHVDPPPPPLAPGFTPFVDAAWFDSPGPTAVFIVAAVLVGASGALLRPRDELAFLLAQGVSRRRWLALNAAASLASLGGLVLFCSVVLAIGGWRAGIPPDLGQLLARSTAVFVAASTWVVITLAVTSLVRYSLLAIALLLGGLVFLPPSHFQLQLPARVPSAMPASWDAWALADPRMWRGGVPWLSVVAALALGAASYGFALWRVERSEP